MSLVLIRILLNFMITTFFNHDLYILARILVETTICCITCNGKRKSVLKQCSPFHYMLGYKATVGRRSRMKGGERCFKKTFPFSVRWNTKWRGFTQFKSLAKIYRPQLKEYAHHKIQQYYDQTSGNCFYIVNLYFPCHVVNAFGLDVLSYRPSSFHGNLSVACCQYARTTVTQFGKVLSKEWSFSPDSQGVDLARGHRGLRHVLYSKIFPEQQEWIE